jgi:type II secretory pathway pseudopilin PulG
MNEAKRSDKVSDENAVRRAVRGGKAWRGGARRIGAQDGVSLSGLIVVLAVLGAISLVVIKSLPAFIEYRAVKNAIVTAKAEADTIRGIQLAFDRNASVNDIDSVHGRDLVIVREDNQLQVSFAYERRVPLGGNVSLLFDFSGTTDPSGVVAANEAEKAK